MAKHRKIGPIHPGEILREDFMVPAGLSAIRVAALCKVPRTRIERIVAGETGITADTALRLGRLFGTSPAFWLNIQAFYDLERADAALAGELVDIEPLTGRPAA